MSSCLLTKSSTGPTRLSVFHAHAYDAINVLFEAIKDGGDPER